jgi:ArsR family transcriptional regulator
MECCAPVFEVVLTHREAADTAELLAALADPARLRIVSILAAAGDTVCGCEMEGPLGLSQPTVSHHLKILREAGLVVGVRQGRWVHYRLVPERISEIVDALTPRLLQDA